MDDGSNSAQADGDTRTPSPVTPRRIHRSELRLLQITAPARSYTPPSEDQLSEEWLDGRRWLDEVTRHERVEPEAAVRDEPPASEGDDGESDVSFGSPLPLAGDLSYRRIDGLHMWVVVPSAAIVMLDDDGERVMRLLIAGVTPAGCVERLAGEPDDQDAGDVLVLVARVVQRLAEKGFVRGVRGRTDAKVVAPHRFMRIHLTQKCNLTCIHCYADSSPYAVTDSSITLERWCRLLDDFAGAGGEQLLLTGGEALLHPYCVPVMRHAHDLRLKVVLFTNGFLVPRYLDDIGRYVDEVQVSIDGPTPASNDLVRGAGSFARAVHAVDLLLAKTDVHVRVNTIAMEENWDDLRRNYLSFADRWSSHDVELRIGFGVTEHGRAEGLNDGLDVSETRPVVNELLTKVRGGRQPIIARRNPSCGYAEQVVVGQDGSIHPCHLMDGALAHIDDGPYRDVLMRIAATAAQYDVDHTLGCNRCDIRYLCGGTCRVMNGKGTGNRRITTCTAEDKLGKLRNLARAFSSSNA
ncbi:MAG: radical SAM protein [Egibacteraceae bacterium]